MIAAAEPISPELVLVSDDLRVAAISALAEGLAYTPSSGLRLTPGGGLDSTEADSPSRRSFVTDVVIYLGWHLAVGTVLGLGVVSAIALTLIVLSMLG